MGLKAMEFLNDIGPIFVPMLPRQQAWLLEVAQSMAGAIVIGIDRDPWIRYWNKFLSSGPGLGIRRKARTLSQGNSLGRGDAAQREH